MRYLIPILILPFNVLITIPSVILILTGGIHSRWENNYWRAAMMLTGIVLLIYGLSMLIRTIRMFHIIGKGTLAPWDPPKEFITQGIYLHTRNPMITGGLITLLGEVFVFGSIFLLAWWLTFFISKTMYFIYHEEPELEKRFGSAYIDYKKNVPRWIPRFQPWIK